MSGYMIECINVQGNHSLSHFCIFVIAERTISMPFVSATTLHTLHSTVSVTTTACMFATKLISKLMASSPWAGWPMTGDGPRPLSRGSSELSNVIATIPGRGRNYWEARRQVKNMDPSRPVVYESGGAINEGHGRTEVTDVICSMVSYTRCNVLECY
jgi:hypothetical protein